MRGRILVFIIAVVMTVTLIPSMAVAATNQTDGTENLTGQDNQQEVSDETSEADTDAAAKEDESDTGREKYLNYLPVDVDFNTISSTASKRRMARLMTNAEKLSSYDSRQQDWYSSNYIEVKNQEDTGMCWAFTMTTCAEISYLKESGGNKVEGLAPAQLAYFTANRVDDPLGGTCGDKNSFPQGWTRGGSFYFGGPMLAGWVGATEETKAPFAGRNNGYRESLAYDDYLTAEGINIIPSARKDEQQYVDQIKSEIENRGAAGLAIYFNGAKGLNGGEYAYYCPNDIQDPGNPAQKVTANHAVTAVGWDDNFSKEKFRYCESKEVTHTPDSDGAFIIQNSWGEDVSGHDKGYFYLSYESIMPVGAVAASVDMEPANSDERLFQYDGSASTTNRRISAGGKVANVFTVPSDRDMYLDSVGFYQYNEGLTSYDINVYTNLSSKTNPETGTKATAEPITVNTTNIGYNKFELSEHIELAAGKKYSIVITMNSTTNFGTDEKSGSDDSWYKFTPKSNPNQSFISTTGDSWKDLNDLESCARIKGYASYTDNREDISVYKDAVQLETGQYVYDGSEKTPEVNVDGLEKDVDYQVFYENNINAGTAKAIVKGIGEYRGRITLNYTISKARQTLQVPKSFEARTGVYLSLNAKGVGTLKYKSSSTKTATVSTTGKIKGIKYGSATVTVTAAGNGNYLSASAKVPVKVYYNIKSAKLSRTKYKYNGKTRIPSVRSVNGSRKYKQGRDYKVTRPAVSIKRGTYKIKVTGIGKYRGTVTKSYKIY